MLRPATIAALIATLIAAPAFAQQGGSPKRIRSVQITKGQACPKASTADEVVVCSTIEEPYRIPAPLRDEGAAAAPTSQSWVNRAAEVDRTSRVAAGLPDTCSAVGTGGQSGCFQQRAAEFAADKKARAAEARASTPR